MSTSYISINEDFFNGFTDRFSSNTNPDIRIHENYNDVYLMLEIKGFNINHNINYYYKPLANFLKIMLYFINAHTGFEAHKPFIIFNSYTRAITSDEIVTEDGCPMLEFKRNTSKIDGNLKISQKECLAVFRIKKNGNILAMRRFITAMTAVSKLYLKRTVFILEDYDSQGLHHIYMMSSDEFNKCLSDAIAENTGIDRIHVFISKRKPISITREEISVTTHDPYTVKNTTLSAYRKMQKEMTGNKDTNMIDGWFGRGDTIPAYVRTLGNMVYNGNAKFDIINDVYFISAVVDEKDKWSPVYINIFASDNAAFTAQKAMKKIIKNNIRIMFMFNKSSTKYKNPVNVCVSPTYIQRFNDVINFIFDNTYEIDELTIKEHIDDKPQGNKQILDLSTISKIEKLNVFEEAKDYISYILIDKDIPKSVYYNRHVPVKISE